MEPHDDAPLTWVGRARTAGLRRNSLFVPTKAKADGSETVTLEAFVES